MFRGVVQGFHVGALEVLIGFPRGSIYTTIMELGSKRPSPLWFSGPNSIIVVYMDPLGLLMVKASTREDFLFQELPMRFVYLFHLI